MEREARRHLVCVSVVVLSLLLGCESMSRAGWGTTIGAGTGAAAGAVLAGDDSTLEGALIGGLVGGGAGYLIGSHLDKKHARQVMQEYNEMMKMTAMEDVDNRINLVADKVLGDSNDFTSAAERENALAELRNALDTAADERGNRDGSTSQWERNSYFQQYKDIPLVQRLQQGY